jgi:thiol-disulfide isomerase/thioredoxin
LKFRCDDAFFYILFVEVHCSDFELDRNCMARFGINRVFVAGAIAPVASILLYIVVYSALTSLSHNLKSDWLLRLSVSALAMTLPSIFVFVLAVKQARRKPLTTLSKVGIAIAVLALGFVARPLSDGILRSKQERNMAMHDVAAPLFETVDIAGTTHRLSDEKGKVVLINRWATWCGPCRIEMPELDKLYKDRKDQGLVVFGLSDEGAATQQRFLAKVPVSYPMLTMSSGVPDFYRDVARYPATYLMDRDGRLQPVSATEDSFAGIEDKVELLLMQNGQRN